MKYSISLDLKYLSMKMNREKSNFKGTGNSVHTTKIVALEKGVLATITRKISETNFNFHMK